MDDMRFGSRNKRGDWKPNRLAEVAPFWTWPPTLYRILKWIPGLIWPWNALHLTTALLYWYFVVPDIKTLETFHWAWVLRLFAANAIGIFVLYGCVEFFFYIKRKQANRYKYDARFPAENPSDVFWFKSQNTDNFLRTYLLSIPIWTFVEVLTLWCFANGWATWLNWEDNWLWLSILLLLLVPAIHEIHFFFIHRLLHWGPVYKHIHSIHHNSVNPSPWSSLSMHPLESSLYFAEMCWHIIIPSHPIVALFQVNAAGYGAINGHIGFDKLEMSSKRSIDSHAYVHYLHHKYFEVNFGADGLVPLDKWFGTWHDGSKEADEQMRERFRNKKKRMKNRQK